MRKILPLALTAIVAGTSAEAHTPQNDLQGRLSHFDCTDGETTYFLGSIYYVGTTSNIREIRIRNDHNQTNELLTFDSNGKPYIQVFQQAPNAPESLPLASYTCDKKGATCTDLATNKKYEAGDPISDKGLRSLEAYQAVLHNQSKKKAPSKELQQLPTER
ncbi:MAG: hypothetical protein WC595_01445 [Candidatus Nanoarchaeia archaeon]